MKTVPEHLEVVDDDIQRESSSCYLRLQGIGKLRQISGKGVLETFSLFLFDLLHRSQFDLGVLLHLLAAMACKMREKLESNFRYHIVMAHHQRNYCT